MAVQYSIELAGTQLSAMGAIIGASPLLYFYTGAQPASCAAADSGTPLATITAPASPLTLLNLKMIKVGNWASVVTADGKAGHFRLKDSSGTTHVQGSVTITNGSGDLILDNPHLSTGNAIAISTFTFTGAATTTLLSSCTFSASGYVRGELHSVITSGFVALESDMDSLKNEITSSLMEMESSIGSMKDEIAGALSELEGVL